MMERAMAWFPCPVCGKEEKARVMTTVLPMECTKDSKYSHLVRFVPLRYTVKKHDGCEFECDIGRDSYVDFGGVKDGEEKEMLYILMDDFQHKMEKGEIEWNKE